MEVQDVQQADALQLDPETLQENYQTNRDGGVAADTDCQLDKVDQALLQVTPTNKEKKKLSATKLASKPILKKIRSVLRI